MLHDKYFAYDKLEIPDEIMKMTSEERQKRIAQLEREAALEKERLSRENNKIPMSKAV